MPVIESERLRMRGHRLDDYAPSAAMWSDPVVVRYISGKPSTPQQSWMRLLNYAGHWALLRFGYWVIEERATNVFLGEIGFADFKRDIDPSLRGIPEIGWVLASEEHGKGFGSEACRAIVAWSDGQRWNQTICIIDQRNAPSIRIAYKCGYNEVRRFEYNGVPTILFARSPVP